jgi:hypothetical protein
MKKTTLLFVPIVALTLLGCTSQSASSSANSEESAASSDSKASSFISSPNSETSSSVDDYEAKTITPVGAPTIAFYDQGSNENWVSTSTTSDVQAAFGTATYDAIIFDGVNGLKVNVANPTWGWKLAEWITGGNFYLVSTKHTASEALTSSSKIYSFGQGLLPDTVFKRLADEYWNLDLGDDYANITYTTEGVSGVKAMLTSSPSTYDYYFIAEPVLTAVTNVLSAQSIILNEIYNLRSEWTVYAAQTAIPQAALFVRESSVASHPAVMTVFLDTIEENLTTAIDDPSAVKTGMEAYSTETTEQNTRFGFTSALAYSLQNSGNRFGIVRPGDITDNRAFVNEFEEKMGNALSFDSSLFLS